MIHEQAEGKLITRTSAILILLMAAGVVAAVYRYFWGLGHSTNLSDQCPWGLWVGVDVMSGVALSAGGFVTAAMVYLFAGKKYHALVRPAVLTGFLGYVLVVIGLLLDLALPWHIWHPIIIWPEHSVMFAVAWCEMLYLTVLALELAPIVLERFALTGRPLDRWRKFTTVFSVAAIAFFVGVISRSWSWTIVSLVFFGVLAMVLTAVGVVACPRAAWACPEKHGDASDAMPPRRHATPPVMLIIAGVVFSTMHQSSLGSLFLLTKGKLDPLWWTPSLPVNFFLSAVAVGFAMVILETTLSAKAFRRTIDEEALAGLARFLAWALWIYLGFRVLDLAARGNFAGVGSSSKGNLFLLEMILGVLVPAVMLARGKIRTSALGRFLAALLVVFGVVFNRLNVTWLAMDMPGGAGYFPSLAEIVITVSIIASLVFLFTLGVKTFPVFARHEE